MKRFSVIGLAVVLAMSLTVVIAGAAFAQGLVMENVTGLVEGRMKPVIVEILREPRASGYRVKAAVLVRRAPAR